MLLMAAVVSVAMSCAGSSLYAVSLRNGSAAEVNDVEVSYPHFYFKAGVMSPGALARHGAVRLLIPETATVTWRTSDGVIHIKHAPVRSVLPAQFTGEINFEITSGDEVKVLGKPSS